MGTPAAGHSQKGLGRVRRSMPGVGARRFASVWHARGGFRQRSPTRALAAERTGAQLATRPLPMKHKGRGRRSRRAHSNSWGEQAVVEDAITPDWALAQPAAVEVRTQSPSSPAPLRAWLSIGIGAASLLGAAGAARLIGARPTRANRLAFAAIGLCDLAYGLSLFGNRSRKSLAWLRVAADVANLGVLGTRFAPQKLRGPRFAGLIAAGAGLTVVDALAAARNGNHARQHSHPSVYINATTTIRKSPDEVYAFWRDFSNIPRFMRHVGNVTEVQGNTTWEAHASLGPSLTWEAQIVSDRPGEEIRWRSTETSLLANHGAVYFRNAPGGRGTEVHVHLGFEPPLGAVGAGIAKLIRALPREQLAADLRRLKQLLELGEIVRSDASIHRGRHPAQPSAEEGGEQQ